MSGVGLAPDTVPIERPRSRRIPSLDVVRGIAIVGTFASNVWLFTAFFGEPLVSDAWQQVLRAIPDGKFLGLLTIMFGIGLEIQRQAARRRGRRWPGTYPVRAALLFVDGMLNYVLIVQFDVLRPYAILGFVIAFVLLLPEAWQWVFIGVALATHISISIAQLFNPELFATWRGIVLPVETPTPSGPPTYWDTVLQAFPSMFSDLTLGSDAGTILVMGLSTFTLGAILFRHGIFEARGARLRKWVMIFGLGAGIPAEVALITVGTDGRYTVSTVIAFGILALVAEFYCHHGVGFVGRRLGDVGRMALSCYILQNILGRVFQKLVGASPLSTTLDTSVGTVVEFFLISSIMIVFATVWMRRFRRGPIEMVWDWSFRALTRQWR